MFAMSLELIAAQGEGYGRRLAVSPNGRTWAAAESAILNIWEGETLAYAIDTAAYATGDLRFSDDARYAYAGTEILDLEKGALLSLPSLAESLIAGLPPEEAPPASRFAVHGAAWSPDGRDLVISARYRPPRLRGSQEHYPGPWWRVLLLDGRTRALKNSLWEANSPEIRAVTSSRRAVAAAHQSVLIWERETCQLIAEGKRHKAGVTDLRFSEDGAWLASTDWQGRVVIWDTGTLRWVADWVAHSDGAFAVAIYQPGSLVATGGADAEIKLWAIQRRPALVGSVATEGEVVALAFYPNGEQLLAADDAGNIVRCTISA
jgi:WD40 repeat protein